MMTTGEEMTQVLVEVTVVTEEVMIGKEMALVEQGMIRTAEFYLNWTLKAVVIGPGCFEEPFLDHLESPIKLEISSHQNTKIF